MEKHPEPSTLEAFPAEVHSAPDPQPGCQGALSWERFRLLGPAMERLQGHRATPNRCKPLQEHKRLKELWSKCHFLKEKAGGGEEPQPFASLPSPTPALTAEKSRAQDPSPTPEPTDKEGQARARAALPRRPAGRRPGLRAPPGPARPRAPPALTGRAADTSCPETARLGPLRTQSRPARSAGL